MRKFVRIMFVLWYINLAGLFVVATFKLVCGLALPLYFDTWFKYTLFLPVILGLVAMMYYIKSIVRGIVKFINE